jgi:hypothetical protein
MSASVKSERQMSAGQRPLYPQKRTLLAATQSAKCHNWTHALQQISFSLDQLSAIAGEYFYRHQRGAAGLDRPTER